MSIISYITSLINIGAVWWLVPLEGAALFFDGWVFYILGYAYNLFLLMCTLNYNSIYGLVSTLLDELQAVILVFIVFKLGLTLINYMLKPEEAKGEGSAKLLTNIFIAAALLISYNFIFTLASEVGMLILGNPTGTQYVVLGQIAEVTGVKDEGLIVRAVFGKGSEAEDVGDFLAKSTAKLFAHDIGKPESSSVFESEICPTGKCDFRQMYTLAPKVDIELEYHFFISFICGVYMVVSLVKGAIQVGVRMFKLLILQMVAPIAIISIISKDGVNANVFKKYLDTFKSVFLEAFTRMGSILIVTVFVCKFFMNIKDYFPQISSDDGFTVIVVTVFIIIAAYKFAGDIPNFIDGIFGTHLKDGSKGNFLGRIFGAGAGAVGGFFAGAAGGGFGGAIAGAVGGGFSGAREGAKGNSIAEFFKSQRGVTQAAKTRGQNIRAHGGLIQTGIGKVETALGRGDSYDKKLAKLDRRSRALDEYAAAQTNAIKELKMDNGDEFMQQKWDSTNKRWVDDTSIGKVHAKDVYAAGYEDVKLGEDKGAYAQEMLQFDKDYINAQGELAHAEATGSAATIAKAQEKLEVTRAMATKRAEDYYVERQNTLETDARTDADLRRDVTRKREAYVDAGGTMQIVPDKNNNVKTEKQEIYKRRVEITNRKSYARTHGMNPKDK